MTETPRSASIEEFNEVFRVAELLVHETEHWTWSVRPEQITLGTGVLALKRWCPAFGALTPAEAADLGAAVAHVEQRLNAAVQPDRINYLMLMMRDHHVHFHVVPRHRGERVLHGTVWTDRAWPGPPDVSGRPQTPEVLDAIKRLLAGV